MTGNGSTRKVAATSSPADMARYAAATAGAADPNGVMDAVTEQFRDLARLTATGDRLAVLGATTRVAEGCLRLCAVPAASSTTADDKVRFLAIMAGWARPRRPALGAVIDAACEAERRAWGGDIAGTG